MTGASDLLQAVKDFFCASKCRLNSSTSERARWFWSTAGTRRLIRFSIRASPSGSQRPRMALLDLSGTAGRSLSAGRLSARSIVWLRLRTNLRSMPTGEDFACATLAPENDSNRFIPPILTGLSFCSVHNRFGIRENGRLRLPGARHYGPSSIGHAIKE